MDYSAWLASSQSYVYVDTPNSNLVCCICRMPFVEPTTSRTCSHSFCHDCIAPALQASPHCPIDRSPLSPRDMGPSSPIVRHMVDELIVECLNQPAGCEFTCQRQLLAGHLKDACLFAEEPCPDPECPEKALRKDIRGDSPRCPHRLVACDSCAADVRANELAAHSRICSMETTRCPACALEHPRSDSPAHAAACPAAPVPCPHAAHGCAWTGPRAALADTHTPHCPYAALAGFFRLADSRAAQRDAENARLRARLDAAEGMLAVVRHELHAVKGALGPWYRPDAAAAATTPDPGPASPQSHAALSPAPPPPHPPHPSPFSPAYAWRAHAHAHAHPEPPADIMAHLPPPPLTPGEDADAELAAYFPPSASAPGAEPPSPSPSPSLPGTLTALRAALHAHDARARIAAGAHAAELAALRQVVAGLRMQLHAVLMERSAGAGAEGVGAGGWAPLHARFFLGAPPMGAPAVSVTKL
ncbi:hypothetical protein BC834DRAFT_973156 [Gloeopeniophorella convolvens]|nr:hypothetical protein BC834DRAFT_973156 [Gloeopeniophorella convolvens]